jgi:beta-xylosidase
MIPKVFFLLFSLIVLSDAASGIHVSVKDEHGSAQNPIIWADVPDPSVIRVGDTYYMSSTTMHMNPGVPIMRSEDLVNWEIVSYAYDIHADSDQMAMRYSQNAYGRGSWASSLRSKDGIYYVVTFSYTSGRTHFYTTDDIENGTWTESSVPRVYHDPSLFFEDDGSVYLVYGINDIRIIELMPDLSTLKQGGLDQIIIPDAKQIADIDTGFYVPAEGAHIHKIDGMYYIFLITWPRGDMRTQLVYRSKNLIGPYEGKIVLRDRGIAQGGLVDTPNGDWYAMLFEDHGAVGRIPHLIPVTWEDGWPILGVAGRVPEELDIPAGTGGIRGIVATDEFERDSNQDRLLPLVWQWNHNPDDLYWSLGDRPGFLRLTNGRIDNGFTDTRNTLTQRTFGPECSAVIAIEIDNMKDGDYAGLGALQENFGFVGIKMEGTSKYIIMVNNQSSPEEVESIPVLQDRVYLRIDMDYRNRIDRAYFYYSIDGEEWNAIGNTLQMYYTLSHFMGYRFALFNYATKTTGGFVDFDYFRVAGSVDDISFIIIKGG